MSLRENRILVSVTRLRLIAKSKKKSSPLSTREDAKTSTHAKTTACTKSKNVLRTTSPQLCFGGLAAHAWHDLHLFSSEGLNATTFFDFILVLLAHFFPLDLEGWRHQVW